MEYRWETGAGGAANTSRVGQGESGRQLRAASGKIRPHMAPQSHLGEGGERGSNECRGAHPLQSSGCGRWSRHGGQRENRGQTDGLGRVDLARRIPVLGIGTRRS